MPASLRDLTLAGPLGDRGACVRALAACTQLTSLRLHRLAGRDLGARRAGGAPGNGAGADANGVRDDFDELCGAVGGLASLARLAGVLRLGGGGPLGAGRLLARLTRLEELALYRELSAPSAAPFAVQGAADGRWLEPAVYGAWADLERLAPRLRALAFDAGRSHHGGGGGGGNGGGGGGNGGAPAPCPTFPLLTRLHATAAYPRCYPESLAAAFPALEEAIVGDGCDSFPVRDEGGCEGSSVAFVL